MFENLTWTQFAIGLGVLLGIVGSLAMVFIQNRTILAQHNGVLILAREMTEALKEVSANTRALDLLEPMATKVVPASLVEQANRGADFLKSFTPDEVDALIDQFRGLLNQVTDGKPNVPPEQQPPAPSAEGSVG